MNTDEEISTYLCASVFNFFSMETIKRHKKAPRRNLRLLFGAGGKETMSMLSEYCR